MRSDIEMKRKLDEIEIKIKMYESKIDQYKLMELDIADFYDNSAILRGQRSILIWALNEQIEG